MSTASKIVWAAAGVVACGVVVGIGLLMAGDWLGRRDEEALKAAAPSQAVASSPTVPPQAHAVPSQILNAAEHTDQAPSGSAEMTAGKKLQKMAEVLVKLNDGTLFTPPTQEAVAHAAHAITVVSDQERFVDRQQLFDATEGNPFPLVLSQSKFIPHLAGAQSGLRVASTADSPWAEKAGLKAGDVVMAVNGKSVLDPRKIEEIVNEFFSASDVAVTVQREGQEVRLQYHMGSPAQGPVNSWGP